MMYINYIRPNRELYYTMTWHVGEQSPTHQIETSAVTLVQADGDELLYLKQHFKNIPFSDRSVNQWFGDMAKFIAGNI